MSRESIVDAVRGRLTKFATLVAPYFRCFAPGYSKIFAPRFFRSVLYDVPGAPEAIFARETSTLRDIQILASLPSRLWCLTYSVLGWPPYRNNAPFTELSFSLANFFNALFLSAMTWIGFSVFLLSGIPFLCCLYYLWALFYFEASQCYVRCKYRYRNLKPHSRSQVRDERWFFINGILNTPSIAELGVERLHDLFKTDPKLLYNPTQGFLVDLLLCVIGRTYDWPTLPARKFVVEIEEALMNAEVNKVVLIGHSQGCIISSNILQLISAKMFTNAYNGQLNLNHLKKLEVYLIASPASEMIFKYGSDDPFDPHHPQPAPNHQRNGNGDSRAHPPPYANSAVYVEAIGNTEDIVARIGCLSPLIVVMPGESEFVFNFDRKGHVMNAHYLVQNLRNYNSGQRRSQLCQYLKK